MCLLISIRGYNCVEVMAENITWEMIKKAKIQYKFILSFKI